MSRYGRRANTIFGTMFLIAILALLISILLPSLGKAREQAKKAYCANNLAQFVRALHVYAGEYRWWAPHNPYPAARPMGKSGGDPSDMAAGFDPNIGWLMTHGMRMEPPARLPGRHFNWCVLGEDEQPDITVCPAANRNVLFDANPELSETAPLEAFVFQYAAFYQTNGIIRSATPVKRPRQTDQPGLGGRNPVIPDPADESASRQALNAVGIMPCVYVQPKAADADPQGPDGAGQDVNCWIQSTSPSEIDNPGRVYYMADSREYRPQRNAWPAGGTNDGWQSGSGNKVFLGARHAGLANVGYLDGHVTSDGLAHERQWKLETGYASDWRCATFQDPVRLANLGTQHHLMPVLNVKGWESFFQSGRN